MNYTKTYTATNGIKVHADWFDEGVDPNNDSLDFVWHKVPTLIQNNVRFLL